MGFTFEHFLDHELTLKVLKQSQKSHFDPIMFDIIIFGPRYFIFVNLVFDVAILGQFDF